MKRSGFKIREAEKAKVPFMLVVGDKEVQSGTVSVRGRSGANLGSMTVTGRSMSCAARSPTRKTPLHKR